MGLFNKQTPDPYENGNLFEEIHERLTEQEIAELEQDAERLEAYEEVRRRARRRQIFRIIGTVLLLFILTVGVVFAGYKFLFVISEIEVVGDVPYTAEEIFSAADVKIGDGLYSFSSVMAEERLVSALPYIESLEVTRHIPNRITFTVKYEDPVYYTEIYGKIYLISDTLRVLGDAEDADLSELIWLRLSHIKEAEYGYIPYLRDKTAQKYLKSVTESVNKSVLSDRITQIDMRNIYDLSMVCDDKYLLAMGEYDEVDTKLKIAEAVLADEMFNNENKARLDLSKLSETAVIVDNKLDFTK